MQSKGIKLFQLSSRTELHGEMTARYKHIKSRNAFWQNSGRWWRRPE